MTIRQATYLSELIDNKIGGLHFCLPGKIVKYDYITQKAEIEPGLNQRYNDGTNNIIPNIVAVPVIHPISGGASITFPVKIGDTVLLVFAEKSLEEWLQNGDKVTPDDPRQNNLTDAIAIIGLRDFSKTSPAENNQDLLIKYDGTEIKIKPSGNLDINTSNANLNVNNLTINGKVDISGDVSITGKLSVSDDITAASNVNVLSKITSATATIGGKDFALHIHSGVTTGGGVSGPVV